METRKFAFSIAFAMAAIARAGSACRPSRIGLLRRRWLQRSPRYFCGFHRSRWILQRGFAEEREFSIARRLRQMRFRKAKAQRCAPGLLGVVSYVMGTTVRRIIAHQAGRHTSVVVLEQRQPPFGHAKFRFHKRARRAPHRAAQGSGLDRLCWQLSWPIFHTRKSGPKQKTGRASEIA